MCHYMTSNELQVALNNYYTGKCQDVNVHALQDAGAVLTIRKEVDSILHEAHQLMSQQNEGLPAGAVEPEQASLHIPCAPLFIKRYPL